MSTMSHYRSAAVLLLLFGGVARADNPVTWAIDQTINRGDSSLSWTSPTAIDLGLSKYGYQYEITKVEATVRPFFVDLTVDITDQVAASFDLTGGGNAPNLPLVLLDDSLDDSETGTMADVRIEVDSLGRGQASFTNIVLGRATVPVFGQVDIQRVRVQATVSLSGVLPPLPGDYNGDRVIDRLDYTVWRNSYGLTGAQPADGNRDGEVNAVDYTFWRDRYDSTLSATTVPEPAALALASLAGGLAFGRRR